MNEMELTLNEIDSIIEKYEQISQNTGEKFNIFKILNITADEVRLHSKFLAEILNPKGSHGQGDKFLSLFIEQIDCKEFKTKNADIIVEKSIGKKTETGGGRIDILIENNHNQTIIIENKIYAKDQENQLVRYKNFKKDSKLYYLTLQGRLPKKMSFGDLVLDEDFYLISYKNDIIEWLEKCAKASSNMPIVKEGINHYINLIRYLTGQSNNKLMDKEITELLVKTPEILKKSVLISNNIENAKIKLQWLFWKYLKTEFQDKLNDLNLQFEDSKDRRIVTWQRVRNYYVKGRDKDKYYGLWIKIYENDDTKIYYTEKSGKLLLNI